MTTKIKNIRSYQAESYVQAKALVAENYPTVPIGGQVTYNITHDGYNIVLNDDNITFKG